MCGHVGIYGELSRFEEEVFEDMLTFDIVRGPHSTGVASVDLDDKNLIIHKSLDCPPYFFNDKKWNKITKRNNSLIMGHNRMATRGEITEDNAHPFIFDPIVGAHNGTIQDVHSLPDYKEFGTDSEAIFYSISLNGIKETWKILNGSAALVWFNLSEKSLNIIKNSKRPLFWRFSEDKKVFLWASESWMIGSAAGRQEFKYKLDKDIFCPKNDVHYKFKIEKNVVEMISSTELEPFSYSSNLYNTPYYGYNRAQIWDSATNQFVDKDVFYGRSPQGNVKQLPPPKSTNSKENKDTPHTKSVSGSEKQIPFDIDTKEEIKATREILMSDVDRRTKRAAKKAEKAMRKLKAIQKRRAKGDQVTIPENVKFYEQYGTWCMVDSDHPLDPSTAIPVDSSQAMCEDCGQVALQYQMNPYALKGM